MIISTGIDIIEIDRIDRAIKRWGDHFIKYVFCKEEIEYAQKYKNPAIHFAARFAAKEAVFKALMNQKEIGWKDIKIVNNKSGRPICVFTKDSFNHKIIISISHTKTHAIANAIITS